MCSVSGGSRGAAPVQSQISGPQILDGQVVPAGVRSVGTCTGTGAHKPQTPSLAVPTDLRPHASLYPQTSDPKPRCTHRPQTPRLAVPTDLRPHASLYPQTSDPKPRCTHRPRASRYRWCNLAEGGFMSVGTSTGRPEVSESGVSEFFDTGQSNTRHWRSYKCCCFCPARGPLK